MDLGVALYTVGEFASTQAIVRFAQETENMGYTAFWMHERLLYPVGTTLPALYESTYESLETLAYLAAKTEKMKLGTSIINAPFHSPVMLARQFATLDQLSNGRVIAGLGQGWMEEEFIVTNSSRKYQGRGIDEFIAAMRAAWGPDPVQFEGKFYRIPPAGINPKPVQTGGIPIIMAAMAPKAIDRAARIADGLNPGASSLEELETTIKHFRHAAQEAGRDPAMLKIIVRANVPMTTTPLPTESRPFLGGSAEQIVADLARVEALAVDHVMFANIAASTVDESVQRFAELQKANQ